MIKPAQSDSGARKKRAPFPVSGGEAQNRLTGQIERVTFHSEETGFAVLKVKARGHRDLVAVVGTLVNVTPGEWVEAEGRWVIDPQHGRQFKANELRTTHPDTLEGIEKYLGSGLIKGIGPVYASKLVKAFGKDVFDIIDNRSKLLQKVEGIGPMRRAQIKSAWNEHKYVREIMTFLLSHGVSTARALRIYRTYGEKAIERVMSDPYCLARDIWGIGFKTADQIAQRIGIAQDSALRARAGAEYVLQELTNDGHCAYPRSALADEAVKILEIPSQIVDDAIQHGLEEGRLVQDAGPDQEPLIYLKPLYQAETQLAVCLGDLMKGEHPCPPIQVDKAIAWVQQQVRLELAPAQQGAIREAVSHKVMIITGGPGVGKTTLVNSILKIFRAKKLKVVLCAPTGRAAKRMSEMTGMTAKTIHRLLEYDPSNGRFKHDLHRKLAGDVFVVDETSMIDVVLAYQLACAIPRHAAVIWVGDVDQLPSVGPGTVLRDLIDSNVFPVCRLTEVFRQAASSAIVTNAHRVNQGQMPQYPVGDEQKKAATDFYFIRGDDPEEASARLVKLVKETLPRRFGFDPLEHIQVITPMQKGVLGARTLNQVLQQALNPVGEDIERFGYRFRVGDKVMQMINDYQKDVFNGDIGRIVELDRAEREIRVRFEGRGVVTYDFQELDEVALSYAITVHKSQGSEYPCVVVPVHTQHFMLLQRNLLYTAITRGKRLVVLIGMPKAVGMAVKRTESKQRVTLLSRRLAAP